MLVLCIDGKAVFVSEFDGVFRLSCEDGGRIVVGTEHAVGV